jgi:type I restriction enzyme, S subunit
MVEGFKNTEVGVIPNDWKLKPIGEVCHIFGRIGFRGYTVNDIVKSTEGAITLSPSNIQDGKMNFSKCTYISWFKYEESPEIKIFNSDIILVKTGSTFGKTAIVSGLKEKATINPQIVVLKKITIDNYFLAYVMGFEVVQNQIKTSIVGGAIPTLSQKQITSFLIPLPPTNAEQNAIAAVLNDTDSLINQLEELLTKKLNVKTGVMCELLKPREGWDEKTLLEIADNKKELFDDGDWIEAEHITDNGIRIIQTGNIGIGCFVEKENKKYIFEKSFYKLKCKLLMEGDLLVCRLAEPAGRSCVLPNIGESKIVTSVDVTIFRPRKEVANRVFLSNLFSTSDWFSKVKERVGGTTHKRISRSSLGKIEISLPKIDEQNRIAKILTDMVNEIQELEIKINKYKMLKQGMMQNLLTGKIRLV